jgi:hypothetical protein
MEREGQTRFWVEIAMALSSANLAVITLIWPDWIELAFHVDPDQGSGGLEWLIVAVLATTSLTTAGLAGLRWRHWRSARLSPEAG